MEGSELNDVLWELMLRILVVDDNDDNLDMLTRRLCRRGYCVTAARDAETAIELAAARGLDLILMDIQLPGMDGWEASRELKADPRTEHIPIIAVTAHATPADRQRSLDAGCVDYEPKPIDFERLVSKLQAMEEIQSLF